MRNEDMLRFMDYLTSEIARRKKFNTSKLINSRESYTILNGLYDCGGKTSSDFEKFKNTQTKNAPDTLEDVLDRLGITGFEALQKFADDITRSADNLVKLQNEGRKGLSHGEFMKLVRHKKMTRRRADHWLRGLMIVFARLCGSPFTARDLMTEYLKIMSPADSSRLYEMLMLTLAPLASSQKKRDESADNASDSAPEPKAQSKKSSTESVEESVPAQDTDSTKLAAQLEELRVELESAYIRLNSSEEAFERFQQESAELAVVDVLGRMNSQEAGKLLDQFAKSEQTLKQLNSSGYEIPKELSSVSLCVRMFMRTMRNVFMISPVHVIGERLTLTLEQSEGYDYSGSDFDDKGEVKTVEVISPGWRYKKEVFSLPKVIECSD